MKANYHSHTTRCRHARGTERELVEKAIENGFLIWGFSDHTPYPFPGEYYSTFRMYVNEFDSYANTILDLKKEYADDIEIHLGLEAEYYPAYFDKLLELVKDYPLEYLIMGQHFVGNEPNGFYSGAGHEDIAVIRAYADQVIEGMQTGRFSCLAHPELISYKGKDRKAYEEQIRHICRCVKETDVLLEVNFLGLFEKRHYPREEFWKIAGEEGCRAIFGIDAHDPDAVDWPKIVYQPACDMLARNHVELVETMPFKAVHP